MTVICGGMRVGVTITLFGGITLVVSLLLGRVFCGWVCPLGAIFDAYGWFLRRLHVNFEGPSPWFFRFKYYLLAAILVIAIFGGVSPLMGFDPIVLLTRTAATVINPFIRNHDEIHLARGSAAWLLLLLRRSRDVVSLSWDHERDDESVANLVPDGVSARSLSRCAFAQFDSSS